MLAMGLKVSKQQEDWSSEFLSSAVDWRELRICKTR